MKSKIDLLCAILAMMAVALGLAACPDLNEVPVTGVTLNKSTLALTTAGQTEKLVAAITPANATNTNVTWTSGNNAVASVAADGTVTAVTSGTATITVQTEDGNKTATCQVTVTLTVPVTGITLTKTTLTLEAGQTELLAFTIAPANADNKNVTWVSSDTDVATVAANGIVTAVAPGTAIITVKTDDGDKTDFLTVTVVAEGQLIAVTGVTLNKSTLALEAGQTEKLVFSITPNNATNKSVTWTSGNNAVASVAADGTVAAIAAGTATITVKTEDGNKTATCQVTVTLTVPVTGISLTKTTLTLAVGQTEKLVFSITPNNATNKSVTWTSGDSTKATVATDGTVSAVAAGTATITVKTADGNKTAACQVTVTTADNILNLPPMKDHFSDYFLMGNIFNPGDVSQSGTAAMTSTALTRHYNALTPENHMKPQNIATGRNASTGEITYNYTNADRMVNAAIASNIKVVGHTLLWHQQNAAWMSTGSGGQLTAAHTGNNQNVDPTIKAANLAIMKKYITEVVTHFKGKIYSWDVLNEVFPDGPSGNWESAMRQTGNEPNPWYMAIGSDFVYEAFHAARLADPNAILYYNDYNLDTVSKSTMVKDMVSAVNAKYATEANKPAGDPAGRLLIEGIGMQSHHNLGVTKASIKTTLDLFKNNLPGIKISISELDILAYQSYSDFTSATGTGTNKDLNFTGNAQDRTAQAAKYGEYMELFLEYSDIIERVSLWGVLDKDSWRSGGVPLLFDRDGKAKASYYRFVGALPGGGGDGGDPTPPVEWVVTIPTTPPVGGQFGAGLVIDVSEWNIRSAYTKFTVNYKAYDSNGVEFTPSWGTLQMKFHTTVAANANSANVGEVQNVGASGTAPWTHNVPTLTGSDPILTVSFQGANGNNNADKIPASFAILSLKFHN